MTKYLINPGDYRHVVTIQELSNQRNEYGEVIDNWINTLKTRAGIFPISGREFFAAETVNSEVSHKVNMRYVSGIRPDMRIAFSERIFHIISVINFQEKNIELQLLCKELI